MKLRLLLYHASFCHFFLLDCEGKGNEKISETSKYLMRFLSFLFNFYYFLKKRHGKFGVVEILTYICKKNKTK